MAPSFYIFGNLNLIPGQYDTWMKAYKEDAEPHVWQNEMTCLSYYFLVPEEQESNHSASPFILAFEAYTQRSDLYTIHMNSDALQTFLPKIGATMITGLDLTHFEDSSGYIDKPGQCAPCAVVKVTRIKTYPGKRDAVLAKLKTLAASVEKNEPETFTYLVLKSLDDEQSVRILERYKTKKALVDHESGKEYLELFQNAKDLVNTMEAQRFVETGYGWLHR